MKDLILHIVGNRPQFIKLAPLYHELEKRDYFQLILHSGQHYDENLSDIFFEELKIQKPYVNLQVGSGSHAIMTAKAMIGIEKELLERQPSLVILYGDTDTTVAGALAAAKLNIPIAHVEGGIRTGNKNNPEECNRIVTDHLAKIIFCSDNKSVENAKAEGIGEQAYCTGDIMYDTFLSISKSIDDIDEENIILMTWHRQENTNSKERMQSILFFIEKLKDNILCPMHPRTVKCLKEFELWDKANSIKNFKIIKPVGYFEMVSLMKRAKLIITDSGGLSKESSFAGSKCLFFTDLDVWHDLQRIEWIVKFNPENQDNVKEALKIAEKAEQIVEEERPKFYGDGRAARKIVDLLEKKNFISGEKK